MERIYIDGVLMPKAEKTGNVVSLSLQVDEAGTLGSISGTRSKRTITIPKDKTAAALFANPSDPGRRLDGARSRKPARIEVGGITVFSGYAQLDEDEPLGGTYGRRDGESRVFFVGNNAGWFPSFQNMLLRDIVRPYITGEEFTEAWAEANTNNDPDVDKYGLFLARVKDWPETDGVKYTDHSFFVFLRPLLQDAFKAAGYTLNSDWLDTDEAKRLIHALPARPYPADYGATYKLYMEDTDNTTALPNAIGGGPPALIKLTGTAAEDNEAARYDPVTGFYTVAFSGHYTLTFGGKAENFYIILDDALGEVAGSTVWPGQPITSVTVFLIAGQQIGIYGAGPISATAGNTVFGITPAFEFGEGYTIDLGAFCGEDWRISDLITGLATAFNLVFSTDTDAGTVIMEPADKGADWSGFYSDANRLDLSGKIDLAKNPRYKSNTQQKTTYRLKWGADGACQNTDAVDTGADYVAHEGGYTFPADRFAEGVTAEEVPYFKKTVMYRADDVRHEDSEVTPLVPVLQTSLLSETVTAAAATEPRLLYFAGQRMGADGLVKLSGTSVYISLSAAWMVNYNDQTGLDPSLSFCTEKTHGNTEVSGLLQRYHGQRLARLQLGVTAEEWVFWSASDILSLDFRRKVLIGGNKYLLKQVDGYIPGNTDSTKTLLEADEVLDAADISNLRASSVRAIAQ